MRYREALRMANVVAAMLFLVVTAAGSQPWVVVCYSLLNVGVLWLLLTRRHRGVEQ